jgi:hypothetical protein
MRHLLDFISGHEFLIRVRATRGINFPEYKSLLGLIGFDDERHGGLRNWQLIAADSTEQDVAEQQLSGGLV